MSCIVQKFGGSSVRDAQHVRHAAEIIGSAYRRGCQTVAVLSAQGKTTDELLAKAREINPDASKRELDMLMSAGEQMSVALCAMALERIGIPAVSLAAWQVGIHTTDAYGDAKIKSVDLERICRELNRNRIVLVAGFQGISSSGDITTLGRGGSDTSAVALAAALHADICQIYTDVDGIYTADPHIVPDAIRLQKITYEEMLELADQGAKVLHNRSMEMAKKYRVNLEVLSSLRERPGTRITEAAKMQKSNIAGIAKEDGIVCVSVVGVEKVYSAAFQLFSHLRRANIHVDTLLQSVSRDNVKEFSFTVKQTDANHLRQILKANKEQLGFDRIVVREHITKISVVGAEIRDKPTTTARIFKALSDEEIDIQMINTSEMRLSVLVDKEDGDAAVRAIHRALFGEQ